MLLVYVQGKLTVMTALQSSVIIVLPVDPITRVDATGASMPPYNFHAAWLGISGVDSSLAISLLLPHISLLHRFTSCLMYEQPLWWSRVPGASSPAFARVQPMRARRPSHAWAVGAGSSETKAVDSMSHTQVVGAGSLETKAVDSTSCTWAVGAGSLETKAVDSMSHMHMVGAGSSETKVVDSTSHVQAVGAGSSEMKAVDSTSRARQCALCSHSRTWKGWPSRMAH